MSLGRETGVITFVVSGVKITNSRVLFNPAIETIIHHLHCPTDPRSVGVVVRLVSTSAPGTRCGEEWQGQIIESFKMD